MNYLWSATDIALRTIESLLKSRIHVSGTEHLGGGPTLFVANHFTRFETFLIPYVHFKATRRIVRCLADGGVFVGPLGSYLRAMDVFATSDGDYKKQIVEDLATGAYDWVIYPEGAMIKNKRVVEGNRLRLSSPWHDGPPRTGAAVFALQAEFCRWLGQSPDLDDEHRSWLADRFAVADLTRLAKQEVRLSPVTITYHPLRPGSNLISRAAERFIGSMPDFLQEELLVEGNLLFGETDIDIHFGTPLALGDVVRSAYGRQRLRHPFGSLEKRLDGVLSTRRAKVIQDVMRRVYSRTAVNVDHLVAMSLRRCKAEQLTRQQLVQACLHTALTMDSKQDLRMHDQLLPALEHEFLHGFQAHDTNNKKRAQPAAIEDILTLAEETGVIRRHAEHIHIDQAAYTDRHDFHSLRLHNPLAVMANELEPSKVTTGLIDKAINSPRDVLHRQLADNLMVHDQFRYRQEWLQHTEAGQTETPGSAGMPRLIGNKLGKKLGNKPAKSHTDQIGVVLCHGYLSVPEEVQQLADYLAERGCLVYLPRLRGHGTRPEALRQISWTDWLDDYLRGFTILEAHCQRVVATGFSAGALLALQAAARFNDRCYKSVVINPALKLHDRRAHFAPLVKAWNRGISTVAGTEALTWIDNHSESPDINYARHPPHSIHELVRLIEDTKQRLPAITCPLTILQADGDPVVDASGAEQAYEHCGSDARKLIWLERQRHGIVRGDGFEEVAAEVYAAIIHN